MKFTITKNGFENDYSKIKFFLFKVKIITKLIFTKKILILIPNNGKLSVINFNNSSNEIINITSMVNSHTVKDELSKKDIVSQINNAYNNYSNH